MRSRLIELLIVAAVVLSLLIVFTPNIEYDTNFRFHIAQDYQFSVQYIHGVSFLPVYQFLAAAGSILILRILSMVCVLGSGYLLYKIVLEVTDKNTKKALTAAALFLLNPLILLYGSLAMSESIATFLIIVMLYCYVKEKFAFSAVALAAGVLISYWIWTFLPFFVGTMATKKKALWYILPIISVVAWLYINFSLEKNPLHFFDVSQGIYHNLAPKITAFGNSVFWFIIWYPIFYVAMPGIAAITLCFRKSKLRSINLYFVLTYSLLLTVGLIIGVIFPWARYFIPLIPFYLIAASSRLLDSKYKYLWIVLYFVLGVIATIWQAQVVYNFQGRMHL